MTDPQPDDRQTEPIWSDRQLLDGLILEIGNVLVPDQYRDDFMHRTGGDLSAIDEACERYLERKLERIMAKQPKTVLTGLACPGPAAPL